MRRAVSAMSVRILVLALLIVCGVVLRVAWFERVDVDPATKFDDSLWYDSSAQNLAAGKGYVLDPEVWKIGDRPLYPELDGLQPTAKWPIGYPLMLAGVYKAFGRDLVAAKLLNVMFAAGTAVLVYLIGTRVFSPIAGVAGAGILMFFPSHIMFSGLLLSEVAFGFFLALIVYLALIWTLPAESARWWRLLALGLLLGWTSLIRGEFIVFPAMLAVVWLLSTRDLRRVAAMTVAVGAGVIIVLTPWTVHNMITMDAFVFGTTHLGGTMLQGHNPESNGSGSFVEVEYEEKYAHLPYPEREVKANREMTRVALEYALTHPGHKLQLVVRRMTHLYKADTAGVTWTQTSAPPLTPEGADRLEAVANVYYWIVLALAGLSAPVWFRLRDARLWMLLLPIAYTTLIFGVLFLGDERYHMGIVPMFALLAGIGLVEFARRMWGIASERRIPAAE